MSGKQLDEAIISKVITFIKKGNSYGDAAKLLNMEGYVTFSGKSWGKANLYSKFIQLDPSIKAAKIKEEREGAESANRKAKYNADIVDLMTRVASSFLKNKSEVIEPIAKGLK